VKLSGLETFPQKTHAAPCCVVNICHNTHCLKRNYFCPLKCNNFKCGRYLPKSGWKIISGTVAMKQ
jgi:hypothetical protein